MRLVVTTGAVGATAVIATAVIATAVIATAVIATAVIATEGSLRAASSWPAEIIAVATDTGVLAVLDKANPDKAFSQFQPFRSQTTVDLAVLDYNRDGFDDVVAACDGSVRVYDAAGGLHLNFVPYGGFAGGVRVATGDVNGDGVADIITGAGAGVGGGHVKVFDGLDLSVHYSFLAFDPGFTGGVYVAAGDIDGDGKADIIVAAGPGGGPHVKVFNGATGNLHASLQAYALNFSGGVRVAASDVDGDGRTDIITGAGAGAPGGHVKVFNGRTLAEHASFFAFDSAYTGGIHVAGATESIAVTPGAPSGAVAAIRVFRANAEVQWLMPFPSHKGGLTIAQSWGAMGKAPTRPNIPGYKLESTW